MKRKGQSAAAWFYGQSFHAKVERDAYGRPLVYGDLRDVPLCERCGRPETDWPDFHLNEADMCSSCTDAEGLQHFAPYVLRDQWHMKGGHCLCVECAPPREPEPVHCYGSQFCDDVVGCFCDCPSCKAVGQ